MNKDLTELTVRKPSSRLSKPEHSEVIGTYMQVRHLRDVARRQGDSALFKKARRACNIFKSVSHRAAQAGVLVDKMLAAGWKRQASDLIAYNATA